MSNPTAVPFSITLADVLSAVGLDPSQVLLIQHPLSHPSAREALESGTLLEYTSRQGSQFPDRHRDWLNFVGEERSSARFVVCYENDGPVGDGEFALTESPAVGRSFPSGS